MASSRTFRIVNGPTKEEIYAAWNDPQKGTRILLTFWVKETETGKVIKKEVPIVSVIPTNPACIGTKLRIDTKIGGFNLLIKIVANFHTITKTGDWEEEDIPT